MLCPFSRFGQSRGHFLRGFENCHTYWKAYRESISTSLQKTRFEKRGKRQCYSTFSTTKLSFYRIASALLLNPQQGGEETDSCLSQAHFVQEIQRLFIQLWLLFSYDSFVALPAVRDTARENETCKDAGPGKKSPRSYTLPLHQ